jgi:hypothetical protein
MTMTSKELHAFLKKHLTVVSDARDKLAIFHQVVSMNACSFFQAAANLILLGCLIKFYITIFTLKQGFVLDVQLGFGQDSVQNWF